MFSKQELETLKSLLVEEAMRMDDDGRDGSFDRSPLRPIYDKIRKELAKQ